MRHRRIRPVEVKSGLERRALAYVSPEDATATIIMCATESGRTLRVVVATDDEQHIITVSDRRVDEGS